MDSDTKQTIAILSAIVTLAAIVALSILIGNYNSDRTALKMAELGYTQQWNGSTKIWIKTSNGKVEK